MKAEAHTLHPAAGATDAIVTFASGLRYTDLSDEVRYYARRHLLDTAGVMISGAGREVAGKAQAVLAGLRSGGRIPVPGRSSRADQLPTAQALLTKRRRRHPWFLRLLLSIGLYSIRTWISSSIRME